jgi:hypothetical protein
MEVFMGDISLIWFAKHYGVSSLGGLAQKAKKHWPPPPPVSVRDFLRVIGLPLSPDASTTVEFIGMQGGEDLYSFSWKDPGAGTPIQATSWQWKLIDVNLNVVGSGTVQRPSLSSQLLKENRAYSFQVTPVNEFGTGPSDLAEFVSVGPVTASPRITATIDNNDQVTVAGNNFNKGQAVDIQATVTGGPSTPNTAPNNVQDSRSQRPVTPADTNGSFTVTIKPQGFGQVQFESGDVAFVLAGETVAVIAKNNNVESFSPGPGVSNIVTMPAPVTV